MEQSTTDTNTAKRIKKWQDRLLDLSKRNRMLNFRPHKKSSLRVDYDFSDLPKFLLENEQKLRYDFPKDAGDIDEDDAEKLEQLQKDHRSLGSISKTIKSADEEYGYNIGYIAYGFLIWHEIGHSDIELKSPIILIPVQIEQADRFSPFFVSYRHGEDIQINPTLIEKLKADFGILFDEDLFNLDLTEPHNIRTVLNTFRDKIADQAGWSISNEAWVDTFNFQNMVILNDLKVNSNLVSENTFSGALLNDTPSIEQTVEASEDINLDSIKSIDKLQILDADSSQEEALYRARRGESFIIQGPPGTGKSQTITNIIAEALYDGKNILFVSEKQAALDVVYEKLRRANLSEFCLKMHNSKQTKNDIRAQLQASVNLAEKRSQVAKEEMLVYERLDAAKLKLNNYDQRLHANIEPINKNAFWIFGEYEKVKNAPELHENVPLLSYEDTDRMYSDIAEYVELFDDHAGKFIDNGWASYTGEQTESAIIATKESASSNRQKVTQYLEIKSNIADSVQSTQLDWQTFFTKLCKLSEHIAEYEKYPHLDSSWLSIHTQDIKPFNQYLTKLKQQEQNYNQLVTKLLELKATKSELQSSILQEYHSDILSDNTINFSSVLQKFETEYSNIFRIFNGEYRNDLNKIHNYALNPNTTKKQFSASLDIIRKVKTYHDLEHEISSYTSRVNSAYSEVQSVLSNYSYDVSYVNQYIQVSQDIALEQCFDNTAVTEIISTLEYYKKLKSDMTNQFTLATECEKDILDHGPAAEIIANIQAIDNLTNEIVEAAKNIPLQHPSTTKKCDFVEQWQQVYDQIDWSATQDYERYTIIRDRLFDKYPIHDLLDEIEKLHVIKSDILPAIKKQLYVKLLEKAELKSQYLSDFSRTTHDKNVNEFRLYDERQRNLAKSRIRTKLIGNIPDFYGFNNAVTKNSDGEIALLKRELAKKSRFMPTRKLIASLPIILPRLKPCIMMSPITVSSYFASNPDRRFDLVIFDEASQVKTETAVTSIMRAKQLIIAGDSKQMPPTNFFNAASDDDSEEGDEELEEFSNLESVLDELGIKLPQVYLKWHYRSRDESLIAFSNRKFYEKRLYTFPSVYTNSDHLGVSYHYVKNGLWDNRNGNTPEAEDVARIVFQIIQESPDKSIGVVAFGQSQATAIETAILKMRDMHRQYEDYFSDDKDEPFFVKNLENVQGDERDIIILSVGYGKGPDGKFAMRFGPLAIAGGERRLNVAISRSKERMIVVSSFHANEIRLDNDQQSNRKLLKDFLSFAENGKIELIAGDELESDIVDFDSPFEEAVYNFITSQGYRVQTQVGVSGYKIDMALVDPQDNSRYILAIECDGASYHGSKTARDRDRLRQDILEGMGWQFHRIWSTDWFYNEAGEKAKLIDAIKNAIAGETLPTEHVMDNEIKLVADSSENDLRQKFTNLRTKYAQCSSLWSSSNFYFDCNDIEGWRKAFDLTISKSNINGMSVDDLSRYVVKNFLLREKLSPKTRPFCEQCIDELVEKHKIKIVNNSVEKLD